MEEGPDLVALEADVIPVQVDINQFNQSSKTFFTGPSNGRRSGRGALPGSLGGWCNFFSPVQVYIKLTNQVRLHILSYKKKRGKSADQVRLFIPSNSRRSGRGAWPGSLGC
jgi:hypothetical protein